MRDSSTRNFNAVPPIRRRNNDGRRNVIIAIMVAVAVAIAVFSILTIIEITNCAGRKNDDPVVNSAFEGVSFEDKLHASADVHKGELLLINASFPYVFPSETPTFVKCVDGRTVHGQFPSGNPIYAYYTQSLDECAK